MRIVLSEATEKCQIAAASGDKTQVLIPNSSGFSWLLH